MSDDRPWRERSDDDLVFVWLVNGGLLALARCGDNYDPETCVFSIARREILGEMKRRARAKKLEAMH